VLSAQAAVFVAHAGIVDIGEFHHEVVARTTSVSDVLQSPNSRPTSPGAAATRLTSKFWSNDLPHPGLVHRHAGIGGRSTGGAGIWPSRQQSIQHRREVVEPAARISRQ
jgi:hypothetical protein